MEIKLIAKASIAIKAPAYKVWQALTTPDLIKQYFFGVDAVSDWKVGSPLVYRGEWQGKPFEDKGTILQSEPEEVLEVSYWSSFSGLKDLPENYQKVTYRLEEKEGITILMVTQDNIASEAAKTQAEKNWNLTLKALKDLLEKK